jgi:hypothetical protein
VKAAKIALIIAFTAALIVWARGGRDFPMQQAFPFLGGRRPGIYELGGLAILLITCWGLKRLRPSEDPSTPPPRDSEAFDEAEDSGDREDE